MSDTSAIRDSLLWLQVAEKLSIALMGKGAFRRFKDVLHGVGDEWVQAWYHWRDDHLHKAMQEWFASLPMIIADA